MGCGQGKALKQNNYFDAHDGKVKSDLEKGQQNIQVNQIQVNNQNQNQNVNDVKELQQMIQNLKSLQIYQNDSLRKEKILQQNELNEQKISSQSQNLNAEYQNQRNQNNNLTDSQYQRFKDHLQQQPQIIGNQNQRIGQNQIPQKYCTQHQEPIGAINVNPKAPQKLCCLECILSNNYPTSEIVQIKDIYNKTQSQFMNNWQYFDNAENRQHLLNIYQNENEHQIFSHIKQKIQSFKEMINTQIDIYFEKIEKSLKTLDDQKESLKNQIEQSTFQGLMKEILSQNNNENKKLEEQITQILTNQKQQVSKIEEQLQEYFQSQQREINYSLNQLKVFPLYIQTYIHQQDLFDTKISQSTQKLIEKLQIQLDKEVQLSVDLIKKSNKWQSKLQIQQNDKQEIEMKSMNNYEHQYYLDLKLQQEEKYEILVEIHKTLLDEYMFIGLLPTSKIHNSFIAEYKYYIPIRYNPNDTYNFIAEKGQLINYDQSCQKEIKIQICLADNIFRWKFGNNINSYKSWSTFLKKESHNLVFYISDINSKFVIKKIKTLYDFEKW